MATEYVSTLFATIGNPDLIMMRMVIDALRMMDGSRWMIACASKTCMVDMPSRRIEDSTGIRYTPAGARRDEEDEAEEEEEERRRRGMG